MLESMIKNPRPTRAEATDVANAVLDGTDCVMLSGETAGGDYPLDALEIMARICSEAEGIVDYNALYLRIRQETLDSRGPVDTAEAIASSAVKTCMDMKAKMLVVLTESGNTARLVAKYRPEQPVICLTSAVETARQVSGMVRGVVPKHVGSMIGTDSVLMRATEMGKEMGWVKEGDAVVAIHGQIEGRSGATNMMRVIIVT